MLLNYNSYLYHSNTSASTELNAGNDAISNIFLSDFEMLEEAQIAFATVFLSTDETNTIHNHFHFSCRLSLPYFTVWQPPKLS